MKLTGRVDFSAWGTRRYEGAARSPKKNIVRVENARKKILPRRIGRNLFYLDLRM